VKALNWEEALGLKWAHQLITVNEPMRQRLVAKGAVPERIEVIYNSPDTRLFRKRQPKQAQECSHFRLVYAGTIARRYGLDVAVRALNLLAGEMDDITLVIAGTGEYLVELRKLAEELGVQEKVVLLGQVPLERIPTILADCDVGITPHRAGPLEQLCLFTKSLECLSIGLPIVSARTRAMEQYLEGVAFFFEPGDESGLAEQIRLIRQNGQLVKEREQSAELLLKRIGWEVQKAKLSSLMKQLGTR